MTPEIKKQAVLTLYQQGQPYTEIAESLLMSKNTVKSICRRSGLKPLPMKDTDVAACKTAENRLSRLPGAEKEFSVATSAAMRGGITAGINSHIS